MRPLDGSALRTIRLGRGISQARAARILGVPAITLWRWENGQARISPARQAQIKVNLYRLKNAYPDDRNPRDYRQAPVTWQASLRERREAAGLSLVSFARSLNISATTLSRYETGKRTMSVALMEAAQRILASRLTQDVI